MAQRKRAKSPVSIPMVVALILLCLTLVSIHFSSGIVARYVTTAEASDSARVIQFGDLTLTQTGGDTQYIIPGMPLNWNAAVTFAGSESATYVFVEVTPTGSCTVSADGLTYTFPPAVTDGWKVDNTKWTFLKQDGNTYVYYRALAPNDESMKTGMNLFKDNSVTVPEYITAVELGGMTAISADFRASVVQSNGFATVADAWASLETNHP